MSRPTKDLPCKAANRRSLMPSRCKQKSGVRSSRDCKKPLARVQYNIDVVKGAQKLQVRDAV